MTIHLVSDHSNHFSHRKCSKNRTDSESVQMSEDDTGHQCCYCQTGDIKSNLYPGIFYLCDICQFSREKICRNNWQTTAVGKCDSQTYQKITDYKINYSVSKAVGKALIHISCISSISLNANPTKKLKRYGATNFFRMIISDNTKSP